MLGWRVWLFRVSWVAKARNELTDRAVRPLHARAATVRSPQDFEYSTHSGVSPDLHTRTIPSTLFQAALRPPCLSTGTHTS